MAAMLGSLRITSPRIAIPCLSWRRHSRARTGCLVRGVAPPSLPSTTHDAAGTSGLALATGAPHVPVLLAEILELFKPVDLKVYVDCTLGAGGHATAIAQAHQEMEALVGIDLDPMAHEIAQRRIAEVARPGLTTHFIRSNYSEVEAGLRGLSTGSLYGQVDAMLMDLGVSSMQLDTAERGFSFLRDGPIDMRMDPGAKLSAEQLLNTYSEAQLGRLIREYGEEKMWRQVARRIVEAREVEPIKTTQQLAKVVGSTQVYGKGKKGRGKQIHPATRTFQALPAAIQALRPGGRLAVISFHGLEDRLVKHAFMRAVGRPTPDQEHLTYGDQNYDLLDELERNAVAKAVTRKPVVPGDAEVAENARSRSAKLRVIERK